MLRTLRILRLLRIVEIVEDLDVFLKCETLGPANLIRAIEFTV